MVNMKKHDIALWWLFFVFLAVRILVKIQYWIVLAPITCALAIVLMVKAKIPSKSQVSFPKELFTISWRISMLL